MTHKEALGHLNSHEEKFYDADARKEGLTLTAEEASDVLDYLEYARWYMNPPKPGLMTRIRRVFTG